MAEDISIKNTKRKNGKRCRLCGKSGRTYKNIFKASIKMLEENPVNKIIRCSYKPISVVIQECLNFQVTKENQVSDVVCIKCFKELTSWSKFQKQCMQQQTSKFSLSRETNVKSNITELSADNSIDTHEKDKMFNADVPQKKLAKKSFEKCSNCKSVFKNLNELSIHRSTDNGCVFTCSHCCKELRSKDTLRNHMKIHSDTNNFCCHVCGLLFCTSNRLYHHFESHMSIKRFRCTYCSKQFAIAKDLEKHIRTHTGERPYKCSECDSTFTQYSLMVRHVDAIHRKIKRFTCSTCNKSFLYKNHFSAHLLLHLGKKDMVCDVCDKRFFTKSALNKHQRNHTGEKPYPCPECDKRFADTSNRKKHVLQYHSSSAPDHLQNKVLDRPRKKKRIQQSKVTEGIEGFKQNKQLPTLRAFLEDPELLLGNLNEKPDDSITNIEEISSNSVSQDDFNNFNENTSVPTLTLTVLDEDENKPFEFLNGLNLLQYDNILPKFEDHFLPIANRIFSNGMELTENDTGNNKLEELNRIFDQNDDVENVKLNSSTQGLSLNSTDVLNLDLDLGILSTEHVDIHQQWGTDILNNIVPCETQSILKMLNNHGTILLSFPENEDFST